MTDISIHFSARILVFLGVLFGTASCQNNKTNKATEPKAGVQLWLTTPDKSGLFEKQNLAYTFGAPTGSQPNGRFGRF